MTERSTQTVSDRSPLEGCTFKCDWLHRKPVGTIELVPNYVEYLPGYGPGNPIFWVGDEFIDLERLPPGTYETEAGLIEKAQGVKGNFAVEVLTEDGKLRSAAFRRFSLGGWLTA